MTVETTPLTKEEMQLLNDQIAPLLRTIMPEAFVPRAFAAIQSAIEQSKKRHGMAFGGMLPNSGQLGIQPLSAREFDLATTWTFRTNWSSTTWQTLISGSTPLSRYTHVVVLGYEDLENVPRSRAIKETVGGVEHPIIDLQELRRSDKQFEAIEPYIAGPVSPFKLEVYVETTGYDDTHPWGFVVAPYTYLVSKTFQA